jgi:hypothetical protein
MDWQTITTVFILTIAAAVLLKRVWAFLRRGKKGKCGSCVGCGGSSKSMELVPLVNLGIATNSPGIEVGRHGSTDVGAEKTA